MGLPRTFVGFSSADADQYNLMCGAWTKNEHIDFTFCNVQLPNALESNNEDYIKRECRARLDMAGTYILLIGSDTRFKRRFVLWETEIAIEKSCRLIGVNLDKWRRINPATCPAVLRDIGALFVPFSPQIVAYALEHWTEPQASQENWEYSDGQYKALGYDVYGSIATRPPKPNPYAR